MPRLPHQQRGGSVVPLIALAPLRGMTVTAITAAMLWCASGPALAANPSLEQARSKYKELDYRAMPALLSEALLQRDISRQEYVEIYRLQGFCYTVLGDQSKARDAFVHLLVVEPGYEMESNVSPRFRGVFEKIKKEFAAQGTVTAQHQPPTEALSHSTAGIPVEVTLRDVFGRVAAVDAQVRPVLCGKAGGWVRVNLGAGTSVAEDRVFKGQLPDPAAALPGRPAGYYLEYSFLPRNVVRDAVPLGGKETLYKVTVGDAAAAAAPCQSTVAGESSSGGGGGVPIPAVVAGVAVAGGAALLVTALVVVGVGGAGGTTAAVLGYCYFTDACVQQSGSLGRVDVTIKRGGSSP